MTIGRFLGGVGALIWNEQDGCYLLLRRAGHRDFAAGAWECVTGRVDQGESFEQAVKREVREELSAEVQIEFILATSHFYRGSVRAENELLSVLYGCTLADPLAIQLSLEHSEMLWMTAQEVYQMLPENYWLAQIIRRAELMRSNLSPVLRMEYRQRGFEI